VIAASVLIPTHDHGPTLEVAARSVLGQTVESLELLIVGDGVPDETRELVAALQREDERVRFFDCPKGPRHGEIHRHAALADARGEIVCYLSDDDLWLPNHVATMRDQLAGVDFTHTLALWVDEDGRLRPGITQDLARSEVRAAILKEGRAGVGLSCAAHTLAAYRRLPHGWRTTPAGIPTDVYMWQQFLAEGSCRASGGTRPTCLRFPSPRRPGWSMQERAAELESWWKQIQDPAWLAGFERQVFDVLVQDHARRRLKLRELKQEVEALSETVASIHGELEASRRASLLCIARDRLRRFLSRSAD